MHLIGEEKQGRKVYWMEPVQHRLFHSWSTMARRPLVQVKTGICCFKPHTRGTGEGGRGRGGGQMGRVTARIKKRNKSIHAGDQSVCRVERKILRAQEAVEGNLRGEKAA